MAYAKRRLDQWLGVPERPAAAEHEAVGVRQLGEPVPVVAETDHGSEPSIRVVAQTGKWPRPAPPVEIVGVLEPGERSGGRGVHSIDAWTLHDGLVTAVVELDGGAIEAHELVGAAAADDTDRDRGRGRATNQDPIVPTAHV